MADPAKIMARIRANGANVVIDAGRLQIINARKLPEGAAAFIRENAKAIAGYLSDEADFEERAAIIEFDGGLTRAVAEGMARIQLANPPAGANAADWTWYVDQASRIMDSHLARAA